MSLLVLTAAACNAHAESADPTSISPGTGPEYSVDVALNPTSPKSGESAEVTITITPVAPWVLKTTTPMKITLECTSGCSVDKTKLTAKDIVDPDTQPKSVSTSVKAAAGTHRIDGDLSFFLCTEEICKREKDDVTLSFDAI
ncbi:MAG: hypothetical protein AAFX94_13950 [Myxococcota bacterium]